MLLTFSDVSSTMLDLSRTLFVPRKFIVHWISTWRADEHCSRDFTMEYILPYIMIRIWFSIHPSNSHNTKQRELPSGISVWVHIGKVVYLGMISILVQYMVQCVAAKFRIDFPPHGVQQVNQKLTFNMCQLGMEKEKDLLNTRRWHWQGYFFVI